MLYFVAVDSSFCLVVERRRNGVTKIISRTPELQVGAFNARRSGHGAVYVPLNVPIGDTGERPNEKNPDESGPFSIGGMGRTQLDNQNACLMGL